MEIPKVGPLGLVDQPEGYVATARSYPLCLRVAAVSVLGSFLTVTIPYDGLQLGRVLSDHLGRQSVRSRVDRALTVRFVSALP